MDIESIQTEYYSEVIQVNVPVRFYFKDKEFDGIEMGEFTAPLMPWQEDMMGRVLDAVATGIGHEDDWEIFVPES